MKKIILLTDYKKRFGSKHYDTPYRSGFDKSLLIKYFNEQEYEPIFRNFSEIDFSIDNFKDVIILYTSSEDHGYHYKSFIEDIVFGLELQGAKVIPKFKYLRANNNKVFMEILREQIIGNTWLKAKYYGTFEELEYNLNNIKYPVVIKASAGASGKGVFLAHSNNELIKIAKKISRTRNFYNEILDYGRHIKHKGYIQESKYRNKIIIQNFVPNLKNDWKVLVYADKYYILYRGNRKKDFRASGSGLFKFIKDIPNGLLDYAKIIFDKFNLPNISMDIAHDGMSFYLLEFQAVYFGTTTLEKSPFYFELVEGKFELRLEKSELEKEYVKSIVAYIKRMYENIIR